MASRRIAIALTLVLGLALTLGRLAAPASATPKLGGVDPSALVSADGHTVAVSGTVDCSQSGDRPVMLRVTLNQSASGVVAEGLWRKQCSDAATSWTITLTAGGEGTLQPGNAGAAVLDPTRAVQWFGETQLVTLQPR